MLEQAPLLFFKPVYEEKQKIYLALISCSFVDIIAENIVLY